MRQRRLIPDLLFFEKALFEVKISGLQLCFNISINLNLKYNKIKLYKHRLNFDFLKKHLGIVSPPHRAYDFLRNMFHMLCSIY